MKSFLNLVRACDFTEEELRKFCTALKVSSEYSYSPHSVTLVNDCSEGSLKE